MSTNYQRKNIENKNVCFRIDEEPIFEQVLKNMVLGQAQQIKNKQRIRLRDAAVLIGVYDIADSELIDPEDDDENIIKPESDKYGVEHLLKEGEVFIQIEPSSFAKIEDQETSKYLRNLRKAFKKSKDSSVTKKLFEEATGK